MFVLGVDSLKAGFFWVVLKGEQRAHATVVNQGTARAPGSYHRAKALHWIQQELGEIIAPRRINETVLKRAELGQSGGQSILERAEVDGVVQAAMEQNGSSIAAIPWATLRVRLGASNKADALLKLRESSLGSQVLIARHTALGAALSGLPA